MQSVSEELLARWQVRKTKQQKRAFEAFLLDALQAAGYADARAEESGGVGRSRNLIAGDPDTAKVIFTAHYDTCAELPVPNYITPMNIPVWIFYQLLLVLGMFLVATAFAALVWLLPLPEDLLFGVSSLAFSGALIFMCVWMIAGKANPHTANDNTSGVIALLEAALALPEERHGEVAFVWFDNEESGLFGSSAFAQKHKDAAKNTLLVNFDCVSDGDTFLVVLPHRMKDEPLADVLRASFMPHGGKEAVFPTTKRAVYPSDQVRFRRGVGVAALKRGKLGLYLDRIHTKEDTAFDEANIACCVDGMLRLAERV